MKRVNLSSFLGYGMAALMQGVVAFVTVPLLIRVLGAEHFALWAIFEPLVASLSQVALLGACYGFIRLLASGLEQPARLYDAQLRHGWPALALVSVLGAVGLVAYLGFDHPLITALLGAVFVLLEALLLLVQSVLRGNSNAMGYALVVWVRYGLVGLGVAVASFAGLRLAVYQYLVVLVAVDALALLTVWARGGAARLASAMVPERARASSRSSRALYWDCVRYGTPIVIASALAMLVSNGDRYVVHALLTREQLAGYVTMAKLAGAMSFASAPVNLWWPSARFKHAADADHGARFYSAATVVLLAYYGVAALSASLLAPLVIQWYGQGVSGYDPTSMALLLAAAVATAMVTPMNVGTLNEGKTHWGIFAVAISAVLGLGAAVLLIPRYGYQGAATAALLAQLAALIFTHLISQRIQPLPFTYRKPLLLLLAFCGAMGLLSQVPATSAPAWLGLAAFAAAALFICKSEIRRVLTS